jgi:DNA excision repair protein ERCC-2
VAEQRAYWEWFPYDEPYEHQPDAMDNIADALDGGEHVCFEGACGTGKTLAALVPAIEHARREDKTVVITTNVHQQTRQFIEEARAIADVAPLRAVVFKGKGSMCHLDVGYEECQVLRDTTRDLVDIEQERTELEHRERELLKAGQEGDDEAMDARNAVMDELEHLGDQVEAIDEESVCDYFRANLIEDTDPFFQWLHADVRTPEDIYEYAEHNGWCGYELLKEGMDAVDLVICNYHHLLDPMIREQFFRWLDCDPDDVIAVFDEAHNVEAAARDHATRQLTEPTLDAALRELDETDDPRVEGARNVIGAFRDALVRVYDDALDAGERRGVDENWTDVAVANPDGRDDLFVTFLDRYTGPGYERDLERARLLGQAVDEEYEEAYRTGETNTRRECQTLIAATFIAEYVTASDESYFPVVSVRRDDTGDIYGRAERYACIPRTVTRGLFESVAATVLMSATLRPFDVLENVLGLEDPVELAYGMTYPEEHRRTFAVDTPPLFSSERENPATQATIESALRATVEFTPGNTLLFFPSYAEAERYHDRLSGLDATRYRDEPGESVQTLKERFTDDENGALFTSMWGTLAEGVSFDGDDARSVAVVGVPYPYLDDRLRAVEDAYDAAYEEGDGWRYAVEIPTVRKTRQAMGRIIRSPSDVGARVLLDRRYTTADMGEYGVRDTFPDSERGELVDVDPEKLQFALLNFFTDHDAYDGAPPSP